MDRYEAIKEKFAKTIIHNASFDGNGWGEDIGYLIDFVAVMKRDQNNHQMLSYSQGYDQGYEVCEKLVVQPLYRFVNNVTEVLDAPIYDYKQLSEAILKCYHDLLLEFRNMEWEPELKQ